MDPMVLVCRTEGNSLEELRLVKIHLELIPEGTKRISILQRKGKYLFSTHTKPERWMCKDPEVQSRSLFQDGSSWDTTACLTHQLHRKETAKYIYIFSFNLCHPEYTGKFTETVAKVVENKDTTAFKLVVKRDCFNTSWETEQEISYSHS